jgi:3-oxoacyl-[acyl-carrier protein] reductase
MILFSWAARRAGGYEYALDLIKQGELRLMINSKHRYLFEKSTMETKPLAGKVALVTGSGRGMGRSIAVALAREGVQVFLSARTESELRAVQGEIESNRGQADFIPGDLVKETYTIQLVAATVARFGGLDILVNNAGIGSGGPWAVTKTEDWDHILAVNARAPFILCREAIPHLKLRGRGHIINILSIGGVLGYENYGIYSVSKNALRALTITLSKELRKENIHVHAISMGAVDTPLMRRGLETRPDIDPAKMIQPEEIAELVLFLVTWKGNGVIDEINIRRPDSSYWAAL